MFGSLDGWLMVCLDSWLVGWLVGWCIGWLVVWSDSRLDSGWVV